MYRPESIIPTVEGRKKTATNINMNLGICVQQATRAMKYHCSLLHPVTSKIQTQSLNEAGVLEELNEDLIDKLVLVDGLHHQHPLLPEH